MVAWEYYNKFDRIMDEYLPSTGEGETMATQIVTAVTKLVYKWYNDGDVYDNVNSPMTGWCNDLSSYANWLLKYARAEVLYNINDCFTGDKYEELLQDLADQYLDGEYLEQMNAQPKQGSIYNCEGCFEFSEEQDEDEDEWW